ncbi:EAL domain-containing protein, partial [Sulfurimonas sp.]
MIWNLQKLFYTTINNTYGHLFGDIVLQEVAQRLKEISCEGYCYRYSADEFVLLVEESCNIDTTLQSIQLTFQKPVQISGNLLRIGFCIGISLYPNNSTDTQELLKDANTALLLAKTKGKEQTFFYEHTMSDEISKEHLLLEELKKALKEELFIPYFQPKVNSTTGEIISFESLVRWENDGKLVPPAFFLHLAEQNDLISELDAIILKKSLKQLQLWHEQGYKISVSVNFTNDDFTNITIFNTLLANKEYLSYLTVEITEGELMDLQEKDLQHINRLKELGIKLSLDDFGTGYSS